MNHDLGSGNDDDAVSVAPPIPPTHLAIPDATVRWSQQLLREAGLVEMIELWRREDQRAPGGRPRAFTVEPVLVAMVLAARLNQPLQASTLTSILFRQISDSARAGLDVPGAPADTDEVGWHAVYERVRSRLHSILDTVDPSTLPKNRRLPPEEFSERTKDLAEVVVAERFERLHQFVNTLLATSVSCLDEETRKRWTGSVALDATVVPAWARPERKGPTGDVVVHSADPDAAWYKREYNGRTERLIWGYEASIAVMCADAGAPADFPKLVIGMAPLHRPHVQPGANGISALRAARALSPAGFLAADRAYPNEKPENFQLMARAMGYRPVWDYRIDQLGRATSYKGAIQVEGSWYCPMMMPKLIAAELDFRNGMISEEERDRRIESRRAFQLRPHGLPDSDGHQRFMCPAAHTAPTARCELKPASMGRRAAGKVLIPVTAAHANLMPDVCAQQTLSIPPEIGAKFAQTFPFRSSEWVAQYGTRSTVEGVNGSVKSPTHEALEAADRRRIRGVAAQTVFAAFLLFAMNLRRIERYEDVATIGQGQPRGQRALRLRRRSTLESYLDEPEAS